MKRIALVASCTLLILAGTSAYAGDIAGRIEGDKSVVWLEGTFPKPAAPKGIAISQRGIRFSPEFAVIVVGTPVEMPNDDNVAHNVYSLSSVKRFNLGVYAKGESRTVLFDQPGVVGLRCWLHERMTGVIVVVPNRFYSIGQNGAYRIVNVPAGTYKVVGLKAGEEKIIKTITVPSTGTATADF